jgi:hypothetical protein
VHQARKHQNHIPPFVHYWAVAEVTAHFAGKLMVNALLRRIVPFQMVVTIAEVDVFFVEDCGPLEGCGYLSVSAY